jgi:hypothetical protein
VIAGLDDEVPRLISTGAVDVEPLALLELPDRLLRRRSPDPRAVAGERKTQTGQPALQIGDGRSPRAGPEGEWL